MRKNKKWFSLPLAMWLVIVISLLAQSILEYIIPFSRDIKGVENSSKAYYQANNWIEEWLLYIHSRNNTLAINDTDEYSDPDFNLIVDSKYSTFSSGNLLPPVWEWNSYYDNNWNTISQWKPIQLIVWENYISTLADVNFYFRVPDLNWDADNTTITLSWSDFWVDYPIINWQLSSIDNTLNASWSIIVARNICENSNDTVTCDDYNWKWYDTLLGWKELSWVDLDLLPITIEDFYTTNCAVSRCILKFSIINKLETNDLPPVYIPFLEWKMDAWSNILPLRYSKIETSWKSYGYKKDIEVKVAWNTVNEAFDFTIFQ